LNIAEYIRNRIDRLPKGYIFTYEDFDADVKKKEANTDNDEKQDILSKKIKVNKSARITINIPENRIKMTT
jgi:hypothetical protein